MLFLVIENVLLYKDDRDIRAQDYKTFFMLNSVEHEIFKAHKYKISRSSAFSDSDKLRILFVLLINVRMLVGILTFMSRKNFMLK